ncbi:MAG: hypothetical protein JSU63_11615 [Phycisphaerales bacterium]|nr:MAG: hypothetical protein JSU63_11615 [Phycisphaerales bacterium]
MTINRGDVIGRAVATWEGEQPTLEPALLYVNGELQRLGLRACSPSELDVLRIGCDEG